MTELAIAGTFVSVGNALQPFSRLMEAVLRISDQLPQPLIIQHGHTPLVSTACQARAFLSPAEFAKQIQNAQVLILHAGAGSVLHAVRAQRIPVILPRLARHGEHVNDHQLVFARQLAAAGRVELAEDLSTLWDSVVRASKRTSASAIDANAQENQLVQDLRDLLNAYAQKLPSRNR